MILFKFTTALNKIRKIKYKLDALLRYFSVEMILPDVFRFINESG